MSFTVLEEYEFDRSLANLEHVERLISKVLGVDKRAVLPMEGGGGGRLGDRVFDLNVSYRLLTDHRGYEMLFDIEPVEDDDKKVKVKNIVVIDDPRFDSNPPAEYEVIALIDSLIRKHERMFSYETVKDLRELRRFVRGDAEE